MQCDRLFPRPPSSNTSHALCTEAAENIYSILELYEQLYGLNHLTHHFITPLFSAALIYSTNAGHVDFRVRDLAQLRLTRVRWP